MHAHSCPHSRSSVLQGEPQAVGASEPGAITQEVLPSDTRRGFMPRLSSVCLHARSPYAEHHLLV